VCDKQNTIYTRGFILNTKDLAKMMLIFNFLYQTKKPTKPVQQVILKMKKTIRKIFQNRLEFYEEADALQKDLYKKAWNNTMNEKTDGQYMSLGSLITILFSSVQSQTLIGMRVLEKAIDSYYFAESGGKDDYQLEQQSSILANEFLRLIDGEKKKGFVWNG